MAKPKKKSKKPSLKISEVRQYFPAFFKDFGPGERPNEINKNRKKRRTKPYKPANHNIA